MRRRIELALKRAIDAIVSALLLVLLLPVFVAIAIAIRLDSPGSPVFVQERIGYRGRNFRMLKFRTMVRDAEQTGSGFYVTQADARITRVGKLLRRFSLDELPQLLHVLTGRMSLVGPRPGLLYQLEHYTPRQMSRLSVRPGITGWSQVNGRNEMSWPDRLENDVGYADHFSLWLDARILFRTPAVWLSGQGLYAARDRFFFSKQDDIPVPSRRDS